MANSFSSNHSWAMWQILLYLEQVHTTLSVTPGVKVVNPEWGGDLADDDELQLIIGFSADPEGHPPIVNHFLWIGLLLENGQMMADQPIWVQVTRDTEEWLWNRIREIFPEGTRSDEYWALGFDGPFAPDLTDATIRDAGRAFAERIATALQQQ